MLPVDAPNSKNVKDRGVLIFSEARFENFEGLFQEILNVCS